MGPDKYNGIKLMSGEEELLVTRPHPLAMSGLALFWLCVAGLGVVYIIYFQELDSWLQGLFKFEFLDFAKRRAYDALWMASIILPMVVMAVFRINFKYVLTLLGLVVANVLLQWKVAPLLELQGHAHLENVMLIAVGIAGVTGVELYRRSHCYFLTNYRIVARMGTIKSSERSTPYSKVDDLVLQKGLLGKILGFGTVIPVTSTGLGMGQDLALAGAGAGGGKAGAGAGLFAAGGKAKNVPRELSMYVLYKVKNPEYVKNLVMEEMFARERTARQDDNEGFYMEEPTPG